MDYETAKEIKMKKIKAINLCKTCAKKQPKINKCFVLTDTVGRKGECSFWTDNPYWNMGIEKSVQEYQNKPRW